MTKEIRVERDVLVVIEVAAWSFTKRKADGSLDYISPLPTPFNYGSVPTIMGLDGDPLDALVLGSRLPRGARTKTTVQTVARIVDAGLIDDKLICKHGPLSGVEQAALRVFFALYVMAKRTLYTLRGVSGTTRFEGWANEARTAS